MGLGVTFLSEGKACARWQLDTSDGVSGSRILHKVAGLFSCLTLAGRLDESP